MDAVSPWHLDLLTHPGSTSCHSLFDRIIQLIPWSSLPLSYCSPPSVTALVHSLTDYVNQVRWCDSPMEPELEHHNCEVLLLECTIELTPAEWTGDYCAQINAVKPLGGRDLPLGGMEHRYW